MDPSHSVLLATSSVSPSGAARATISPGMTLDARLSTTTLAPSRSEKACAAERATKSLPPPMAVVTMRSGRSEWGWAATGATPNSDGTSRAKIGTRGGKGRRGPSRRRAPPPRKGGYGGKPWVSLCSVEQRGPSRRRALLPSERCSHQGRAVTEGNHGSGAVGVPLFRRAARPEPEASAAPLLLPLQPAFRLHCLDGFAFR